MPNIKSSVRSVKTDAERRAKNAPVKAAIRNIARKVVALTETGTQEDAKATYVTKSQCYGIISIYKKPANTCRLYFFAFSAALDDAFTEFVF